MITEDSRPLLQETGDNGIQCRNKQVKLWNGSVCECLTERKGRGEGRVAGLGQHSVGFWPRETYSGPTSEHMFAVFQPSDNFTPFLLCPLSL